MVSGVTMKVDLHLKNLKESLEVIEECIQKGIQSRQRTIGFNTSAACIDMLEILLHKKSLIEPGFVIKHEWLKSKTKISEKFPFDFIQKEEILNLIFKIEEKRNLLCYGKPKELKEIHEVIENFNKLKKIFKGAGLDDI